MNTIRNMSSESDYSSILCLTYDMKECKIKVNNYVTCTGQVTKRSFMDHSRLVIIEELF